MKFLIAHNRPEIGVFAGMVSPTRYAWTNNGDDAGGAVCYDSYARAVAAQDELRKAGFYRLRIANCVADMQCPNSGEWRYASPYAVVAALGAAYGWINSGVICYGNS